MSNKRWPIEREQQLARLWKRPEWSAATIAELMRSEGFAVSRHAVIGKAYRMGLTGQPPGPLDFNAAVARIAADCNLTVADVMGRSRRQHIVECRWRIFAFLRRRGWSTPQIARRWDMDHTTVIHGLREHQARVRAASASVAEAAR